PRCDDLIVESWFNALFANAQERRLAVVEDLTPLYGIELMFCQKFFVGVASREDDVALFPVAFGSYAIIGDYERSMFAQELVEFSFGPDVILSFLSLAVGIECRVEPAVGVSHLPREPFEYTFHDIPVFRVARGGECFGAQAHELAVVVQHLLKVWGKPFTIYGIAGK